MAGAVFANNASLIFFDNCVFTENTSIGGGVFFTAVSLLFLWLYFSPGRFSHLLFLVKVGTVVLFIGPLLASGVALLRGREERHPAGPDGMPGEGGRQVEAEAG